jgi:uncharacterized protein YejL (UPF0352 family)
VKEVTWINTIGDPELIAVLKDRDFDPDLPAVYYSNQVVTINNSKLSEKEKNHRLAKYLSEALENAIKDQKLDSLQLDETTTLEVFEKIRNSETYLEGIAAASPIVRATAKIVSG